MANAEQRLVIDGQLLQTAAWNRGMGKYCLSLLEAYSKDKGSGHITIILNNNLPIEEDRLQQMQQIMPEAEVIRLSLPGLTGNIEKGKKKAAATLSSFIRSTYGNQPVDFLLLNLFTFDYCAAFPENVRKLLLFFDLIPLIYWADFSKLFGTNMYFGHFPTIYEADHIFSISQATKQGLVDLLGVDPTRITNLRGAFIAREKTREVYEEVKIPGRYILFPSADFPHKNNLNAVKAFAEFNDTFGDRLSLVITSDFSEDTKRQLEAYSESLIFTGNVSDAALESLYENSETLLFASKAEGLGLPVLEAVSYDKPVVCSRIEVFNELSGSAFYTCDPDNPGSIAEALTQAYIHADWSKKRAAYKKISAAFTWDNSAKDFADQLKRKADPKAAVFKKAIGAIVMPAPSESGNVMGQHVQSAAGCLLQKYEIDYFVAAEASDPLKYASFLSRLTKVRDISELKPGRYSRYASVLYCIDDSAAAATVLRWALALPGIALLATKRLDLQVERLIQEGYIGRQLAEKVFGAKITHKSVETALKQAGNRVADFNGTDLWPEGRELGSKIASLMAGGIQKND